MVMKLLCPNSNARDATTNEHHNKDEEFPSKVIKTRVCESCPIAKITLDKEFPFVGKVA
jgi:hypothetical protein